MSFPTVARESRPQQPLWTLMKNDAQGNPSISVVKMPTAHASGDCFPRFRAPPHDLNNGIILQRCYFLFVGHAWSALVCKFTWYHPRTAWMFTKQPESLQLPCTQSEVGSLCEVATTLRRRIWQQNFCCSTFVGRWCDEGWL